MPEMARLARAYQAPPRWNNIYLSTHTLSKVWHVMFTVRRVLLEHKRGGREAVLRYYSHPSKYTPDQYLQARSIGAWKDFGWVPRKLKWHARDAAFNTSVRRSGTSGSSCTRSSRRHGEKVVS